MRWLLALLFLTGIVFAQSQRPSPTIGPIERSPQQPQTQATQQPATPDLRGTDQMPLVIKPLKTPKTPEENAQDARDRDEKASLEWHTLQLGVFTLVVLALQLVAFIYQGWKLRQTVIAMSEQSKDTQRSIAESARGATAMEAVATSISQNAKRQLRAYVAISKLRIRHVELGSKPVAVIKLKNSGQTPAYDFKGNFGLGLFPYPYKDIRDPPTAREISVMDVGPNQAVVARAELSAPLEQKHIDALRDGRGAMLLVGRVTYRDAFGETQTIDARLQFTSRTFGSNKMEVCPEGNKST